MRSYKHSRAVTGARIVAFIGLGLLTAGLISCSTGRASFSLNADGVSREVLPLDDALAFPNLYDAIEHIRPEYLRTHEQGPTVLAPVAYVDGVQLADPQMLRIIPVRWAASVRWVRPNVVSPLYGFRPHLGGGIFVTTKR